QAMHVVAVDRRDEGLMQALDHRMGDLVALVLDGLHALGLLLGINGLLEHLGEERRRLARAVRVLLEEVEELLAPARREEPGEESLPRRAGGHLSAALSQPPAHL